MSSRYTQIWQTAQSPLALQLLLDLGSLESVCLLSKSKSMAKCLVVPYSYSHSYRTSSSTSKKAPLQLQHHRLNSLTAGTLSVNVSSKCYTNSYYPLTLQRRRGILNALDSDVPHPLHQVHIRLWFSRRLCINNTCTYHGDLIPYVNKPWFSGVHTLLTFYTLKQKPSLGSLSPKPTYIFIYGFPYKLSFIWIKQSNS